MATNARPDAIDETPRRMNGLSDLSPESRLLLLLVRRDLTPETEARCRRLLEGDIDWPALIAQARVHGVLPLVARQLRPLGCTVIPSGVQAELAARSRLNAVRNVLLAGELVEVLRLLQSAGIPVVPLKGPALEHALYSDISARVCADLDILIPRNAVAHAYRLLRDAGYEHGEMGPVAPGDFRLLLNSNMEYAFVRHHGGFPHVLEVHWDVAWRWRGEARAIEDLWAHTRPVSFGGADALGLSPEWGLLYLVVHATRHRWQELKWLVDIHEICRAGAIDWNLVGDKARRFGWVRPMNFTLSASHALFETPIPPEFRIDPLPGWVRLFPAEPTEPAISDALFAARLFPGFHGKLGYLAHLLLVPTLAERRLFRLPRGLGLLYYALRPARIGGKRAWSLLRAGMARVGVWGRMRAHVTL